MMRKQAAAILVLALTSGPALALDDELKVGEQIYGQFCAVCHGEAGKGDGMMSDLFKVKPRDLSKLTAENGGEYPFELVYGTLKATEKVPGHGATAMPVWGDFFMVERALEDKSMKDDAAYAAIGKMLSVVYYIETLQEKPQ